MASDIQPILVAACGNLMAGDDAFGPLVAHALRAFAPPHLEVVDLGMKPAGLLDHLDDRRALIIVDAAIAGPGFPEGSLVDIDFYSPVRPPLLHDAPLSSHGLSISHELELAKRLGRLPQHVILVAAAAGDVTVGNPTSTAVANLVEPAVRRILGRTERLLDTSNEKTNA